MGLDAELLTGPEHGNFLKLFYADFFDQFDAYELRHFCHDYARYSLPTIELIAWLEGEIAGRTAIEIGAGSGDLGHHLGIPMTDDYQQERPEVKFLYDQVGQPTIRYGRNVEKIDALSAQEKYKPQVIIGAWVTHWIDPHLPPPPGGGNMWGVKEPEMLERLPAGGSYIMIGAEGIHCNKKIMNLPHETHVLPFLRSRRRDNRIWVWNKS